MNLTLKKVLRSRGGLEEGNGHFSRGVADPKVVSDQRVAPISMLGFQEWEGGSTWRDRKGGMESARGWSLRRTGSQGDHYPRVDRSQGKGKKSKDGRLHVVN